MAHISDDLEPEEAAAFHKTQARFRESEARIARNRAALHDAGQTLGLRIHDHPLNVAELRYLLRKMPQDAYLVIVDEDERELDLHFVTEGIRDKIGNVFLSHFRFHQKKRGYNE